MKKKKEYEIRTDSAGGNWLIEGIYGGGISSIWSQSIPSKNGCA